jgi:hypothetical protein
MWGVTNVLNGMRVPFSLCIDFYFYHTYKKEWQWITLEIKGRRSKVQWNGEVLLGWSHKLDTWRINKDPKQKWDNIAKTYKGNQVIWNNKWRTFDSSLHFKVYLQIDFVGVKTYVIVLTFGAILPFVEYQASSSK